MSNLKNGPISTNDLMSGLAKAKKLMNKVETNDYQKGFIDENAIIDGEIDNGIMNSFNDPENLLEVSEQKTPFKVVGHTSLDKIENSRLPENIKKIMRESPIPEISLNDTIDSDFIRGAKRLMEEEGTISKKPRTQVQPQSKPVNQNEIINAITPIIENIVRKTVTEILDKKLDQLLTAQKTMSINENLVLKVGDSLFSGKITGVKSVKKSSK